MRTIITLLAFLACTPVSAQTWRITGSIHFDLTIEEVTPVTIPNPVAFWKLSDTQSSVGSFPLDNMNSVTFTTGKLGNAATFTAASSQWLAIPNASLDDLDAAASFTLSAWVKWDSNWTNEERFICGIINNFEIHAYDNVLTASPRIRVQLVSVNKGESVNLTAATWYHVVYVHDAENDIRKVWINGSKIVETADNGAPLPGANDFTIGAISGGGNYWDGQIDAVGMWNQALSDANVAELYNGGNGLELPGLNLCVDAAGVYQNGMAAAGVYQNGPTKSGVYQNGLVAGAIGCE